MNVLSRSLKQDLWSRPCWVMEDETLVVMATGRGGAAPSRQDHRAESKPQTDGLCVRTRSSWPASSGRFWWWRGVTSCMELKQWTLTSDLWGTHQSCSRDGLGTETEPWNRTNWSRKLYWDKRRNVLQRKKTSWTCWTSVQETDLIRARFCSGSGVDPSPPQSVDPQSNGEAWEDGRCEEKAHG